LLSEIPYCSCLIYSPKGKSEISRKSQTVRDAVKAARSELIHSAIKQLQSKMTPLAAPFFGPDVVLVPAPGSSPLVGGATWPAHTIAKSLVQSGLGREVVTCLKRTQPVPKSAYQTAGNRPTPQRHFETMAVDSELIDAKRILVVDDILTKGSTLLAGASRVAEAYPNAQVRAFALVSTRGLVPDVDHIIEVVVGRITFGGGSDIQRIP